MKLTDFLDDDVKNVLLVEPDFPIPIKSRNHSNFLPIGLLKIASYLRSININVKLVRFNEKDIQTTLNDEEAIEGFIPDLICVTSIFTYWSEYVRSCVGYYKKKYDVPVVVGGVYASLMPEHCRDYTGCDGVIIGTVDEAEKLIPAYDLVDVDYQIIHTSRGCTRRCGFCGTYIIEPAFQCKKSIKDEVIKKKLVFYDNNLLVNPYIEDIFDELIQLRKDKVIKECESQSGFDGRILLKKPHLASMLKKAGFKSPKIAWDNGYIYMSSIKKQVAILKEAGYKAKDIGIFVLYNYELDYNEMEKKRKACADMGVQVMDCRYRPLNQTFDNYNGRKRNQTNKDYYIHPKWSDYLVKLYRKNIRRHNQCIRFDIDFHSYILENKRLPKEEASRLIKEGYGKAKYELKDAWSPYEYHYLDLKKYI